MSFPNPDERINEFFERLHTGIPPQNAIREGTIRELAMAFWRVEVCNQMEASFFSAIVAAERAIPESASMAKEFDENILLGLAVERDCAGPNGLNKILRYQTSAHKQLIAAEENFNRLMERIRFENSLRKTNPIAAPVNQPAPAEQAQPQAQPARNAQCTCGSGLKYKRCCGAAPVVARAAA